jgi:hypothetical protein
MATFRAKLMVGFVPGLDISELLRQCGVGIGGPKVGLEGDT